MAFSSSWQLLSPVQWAKWTWSAVRGSGPGAGAQEEEEEDGQLSPGPLEDLEDQDGAAETKSLSLSSDSEGNFETPEAETPIHSLGKELVDLLEPEPTSQDLRLIQKGLHGVPIQVLEGLALKELGQSQKRNNPF